MKSIRIEAYLRKNLGDDLFVKLLLQKYPNENFYIFCAPKYQIPFMNNNNVHMPNKFSYLLIRAFEKSGIDNIRKWIQRENMKYKAIVQIGGSIFIEPENWTEKNLSQKLQNNYFYIGANFGPYRSQGYVMEVRNRIANANSICFRDKYSAKMFMDLDNVSYAPDCLFSYPYPKVKSIANLIGISVIDLRGRSSISAEAENYYSTIAEFSISAIKKGYKIRFFSFCEEERDPKAINEIINRINDFNEEIIYYSGNTEKFLESFGECSYILATRFHAMIIGWVLGKKVLPIIYSNKQSEVISDVGENVLAWNILEGEKYGGEELFENCLSIKQLDISELIQKSKEQFLYLDNYLNNRGLT